jgi:predicted PhzF superfamily epimerase YddE/YHI9
VDNPLAGHADLGSVAAMRRRTGWMSGLAPAVLVALALAGCTPAGPVHTERPTPEPTPLFASDEEALAAAEAAYGRYLEVSDSVATGGWADTAPLSSVETGRALKSDLDTIAEYRKAGLVGTGTTTYSNFSLQRFDGRSIVTYVCLDVSATDIVDSDGASVVPIDRPPKQALTVEFEKVHDSLLIERSEVWSGGSVC